MIFKKGMRALEISVLSTLSVKKAFLWASKDTPVCANMQYAQSTLPVKKLARSTLSVRKAHFLQPNMLYPYIGWITMDAMLWLCQLVRIVNI